MAHDIRRQLLEQGLIKPEDLPEARRAAIDAARPAAPEKSLPPPFEAPARGVIVNSSSRPAPARAAARCVECGAPLPTSLRAGSGVVSCAECIAAGD